MHVGVPSVIALLWVILVSGCAGNEISPAQEAAAPAPGDSSPVTALYAAPTDGAFVTVSDIRADIVGPDGMSVATFYGPANATELAPLEEVPGRAAAPVLAGPKTMAPPANDVGWDILITPPPDAK